MTSTLRELIRHDIEQHYSDLVEPDYELKVSEDDENLLVLNCGRGFLTSGLTERFRNRLVFVSATAEMSDSYPLTVFLEYLEPKTDTFMDSLADSLSTEEVEYGRFKELRKVRQELRAEVENQDQDSFGENRQD